MVESTNSLTETALESKFQRLMELGAGGMGRVHLAMSRGPRGFVKLVVLKSLKSELLGDESVHRMFLEEARISARLTHANLVQTYEVLELDGVPTMVLEYVEGQPLSAVAKVLTQAGRLDIYLTILTNVLAGLHAAHELRDFDGSMLNLVHRDASPQNVMVQYDGQVKVLDFGIAKTKRSRVETDIGVVKGKLRYMAPEQLVGDTLDRRADVFSVGIMLWEALNGKPFWEDVGDSDIMRRLLNGTVWQPPQGIDQPKELLEICERALASNRDARFATAGEFLNELTRYLVRTRQHCQPVQIAEFMQAHFAPERERTNQIIDQHIRAVDPSVPPAAPCTRIEVPTVLQGKPITAGKSTATVALQSARPKLAKKYWVTAGGVFIAVATLIYGNHLLTRFDAGALASTPAVGAACPPATKSCAGQCVPLEQPQFGCSSRACSACQVSNATPRCNQQGGCDIAVCYQAFDNCDGDVSNGCETNVRTDPDHCGSCQHRCPELPHAQRGCGDVCTIWRCATGYRDCNGTVSDGCEVSVSNDSRNCGHCGVSCPAATHCRNGRCEP